LSLKPAPIEVFIALALFLFHHAAVPELNGFLYSWPRASAGSAPPV